MGWLKEMEEKFLPLVSDKHKDKEHVNYLMALLLKIDDQLKINTSSGLTFFHGVTLYNHLANLCTRKGVAELPEDVFGDIAKEYPIAYNMAKYILNEMEKKYPNVNQMGERQHLTIIISDISKQ